MAKRDKLFVRLSDEDKKTLQTGLLDLRASRETAGFFLSTEKEAETEKHFKNGEVIFENKETEDFEWDKHPQGFVICQGDKLLLNGKKLLYEGWFDNWRPHPDGVVIRKGNQFLLNGEKLLYKGKFNAWASHPDGFVIQRDNKLFLYDGKPSSVYERKMEYIDNYEPDRRPYGTKANLFENKIVGKGMKLLYDGGDTHDIHFSLHVDNWNPHPDGVVIRKGNQFLLNGEKILYKGEYDDWATYPDGVIIQKGRKFLLNGNENKLLYKGGFNNWNPHQDGIIIQKGRKLIFYNGRKE